ncbi:glycosyltransferase family 2 protein [Noviherbaspirillum sp. Root189]|uniref:glycosyltransferase family 2 protein n=1 Tax=Noviherbaspirillum sp. Root189 TaxID=1736487 RepID=UPI00070C50E8|nr:glycosyltransferase family 2 protein [Noviherbaspirillum sp. Root189]KRB85134.1 bactoprenol glucosyl transferase [Noviherbaspirillum sp. Root189]
MTTSDTRHTHTTLISIVAPFYNEAEGIDYFRDAILAVVEGIADAAFEIVCVDDGSKDSTLQQLIALSTSDPRFRVLELTRNFGKEAALTAGIDFARGDAVIPIDSDLQDPPELIPVLIEEWRKGAEVVLARRADRGTDSFLKRKSAEMFYSFHNRLSSVKIPQNVGDFRLMDRVAVDALKSLPERQRFMKGLFAWIGYKTVVVDYVRKPRAAGETKFSGWKLWNFALEGITSFSTAPLRVWTYIGGLGALLTVTYAIAIILRTLIHGVDVPGYASLLVAVLFFGSLQLISVGLLGEYIGRIYLETKQRPTYLIRREYGAVDES